MSVRLVLETRAKCRDFVARFQDDGILLQLTVPSAAPIQLFYHCPSSKSIEDREIGDQLALLRRELADQLKVLFTDGDDEGAFIIPALVARSHVLSIKDRRNGVGKQVFKHAPLGSGQTFSFVTPELSVPVVPPNVLSLLGSGQLFVLVAPDLCVPGVPGEVLQKVISQASTANV